MKIIEEQFYVCYITCVVRKLCAASFYSCHLSHQNKWIDFYCKLIAQVETAVLSITAKQKKKDLEKKKDSQTSIESMEVDDTSKKDSGKEKKDKKKVVLFIKLL